MNVTPRELMSQIEDSIAMNHRFFGLARDEQATVLAALRLAEAHGDGYWPRRHQGGAEFLACVGCGDERPNHAATCPVLAYRAQVSP